MLPSIAIDMLNLTILDGTLGQNSAHSFTNKLLLPSEKLQKYNLE